MVRLTNKEKSIIYTVLEDGIYNTRNTLSHLNGDGGYECKEDFTKEEVDRVIVWILNKCGV